MGIDCFLHGKSCLPVKFGATLCGGAKLTGGTKVSIRQEPGAA